MSDNTQFLKQGGMIQFVLDGDKVRFSVNVANAQNAGLYSKLRASQVSGNGHSQS